MLIFVYLLEPCAAGLLESACPEDPLESSPELSQHNLLFVDSIYALEDDKGSVVILLQRAGKACGRSTTEEPRLRK